ncbi:MAG: DUF547 domain-containing protein [Aureispira sp.]|nr:DUF547 domain-containing protein [Aureispira sp.]
MLKQAILYCLGSLLFLGTLSANPSDVENGVSHKAWDDLLKKHVSSTGKVNYEGFKADKSKIDAYIKTLANNHPSSSWSKNAEMAFWINLYNAFTIQQILEVYPVSSIMKVAGGKVWDTKKVKIGSKYYTLNQIEKDMLLKKFKEPRVHFAVNCAAKSCPPLMNKAWTESNIQSSFDLRARMFVNNLSFNTISSSSIQISKIFEWYASDFGGSSNLIKYINKYSKLTVSSSAKVIYKEYDWNLNK